MEKTLETAKTLYRMYHDLTGENMEEMRMQKLMYFAQRESLMQTKEPLFDGTFYGWKYGPVLLEIKEEFKNECPFENVQETKSAKTISILKDVLDRYGCLSRWKLSSLSHGELSWKRAREGLKAAEDGNVALSLNAMMIDAIKERVDRKVEIA